MSLSADDVLNQLLSNACGILTDDELKENGGWQEYHIELHCASFTMIARSLGDLKYEVREVRI
jgi:hypothetical protein